MAKSLMGECECRATTYRVADEFLYAANCHCSRCRAGTGTAFKSFAGIEREKLFGKPHHRQIDHSAIEADHTAARGLRSVDDIERLNVRGAGVHPFTMRDIDERGMRTVMQEAIHAVSSGTAGFHLSFDLDAVDPDEAPGVGTPVHGGITYREAHLAMEIVNDSGLMTSLEMVELNPVLDIANRTAILGVELLMSALGKRIL